MALDNKIVINKYYSHCQDWFRSVNGLLILLAPPQPQLSTLVLIYIPSQYDSLIHIMSATK